MNAELEDDQGGEGNEAVKDFSFHEDIVPLDGAALGKADQGPEGDPFGEQKSKPDGDQEEEKTDAHFCCEGGIKGLKEEASFENRFVVHSESLPGIIGARRRQDKAGLGEA